MATNVFIIVSAFNLFFYLLVPAFLLWYVYFRVSRKQLYELASKINGSDGLPLIGHALDLMHDPEVVSKIVQEKYFKFKHNLPLKMWVGPRLLVFLSDPRDVEVILASNVYMDKSPEYGLFKPWLGQFSLLTNTGEKWKVHRRLISTTFHLNVLKSFVTMIDANSRDTVNELRQMGNSEIDIHDFMSEFMVGVLLETIMGVGKQISKESRLKYSAAALKMTYILHMRHTHIWLKPNFIFNLTEYAKQYVNVLDLMHRFTKNVIITKKEALLEEKSSKKKISDYSSPLKTKLTSELGVPSELSFAQSASLKDDAEVENNEIGEKKRVAFLDLLIESAENGVISDEEVRNEVETFMFEGNEVTASSCSFFICLMGVHQDVQKKVAYELYTIFNGSDRPVTYEDTLQMKYLERCIMETMRLYTPVPFFSRQLKENVKLTSSDVTLPAGATIIIAAFKIHRDENVFPNPDAFDPDHFLPEKTTGRHYYAYLPFSAGPRSCIGRKYAMLKMKIILSTILRHFKVNNAIAEKDWKLQADIVLKRADGYKISLEPRKFIK